MEFGGIIPDSGNYEGEIDNIEISHERTRHPNEPLTEEEHAIWRSGLGKLMRIARIARPGAIYDAPADAQTFPEGELLDVLEQKGDILANGENEDFRKEKEKDFEHIPGLSEFIKGHPKDVNKVNLLKKIRK